MRKEIPDRPLTDRDDCCFATTGNETAPEGSANHGDQRHGISEMPAFEKPPAWSSYLCYPRMHHSAEGAQSFKQMLFSKVKKNRSLIWSTASLKQTKLSIILILGVLKLYLRGFNQSCWRFAIHIVFGDPDSGDMIALTAVTNSITFTLQAATFIDFCRSHTETPDIPHFSLNPRSALKGYSSQKS